MVTLNPRSTNACASCRRRKVKCSGKDPCSACIKHGWECSFERAGRKRYSEAHVKHLLEKIRAYEERLGPESAEPPGHSPAAADTAPNDAPTQQQPQLATATQNVGSSYEDSISGISPATDLTSGPAFESQVRSLLDTSRSGMPLAPTAYLHGKGQQDAEAQCVSIRTLLQNPGDLAIPSLEESQHLLDQFLFYLGVSQHFFDPRSFSDSMMMLLRSPDNWEQQMHTTFYTEYLLVMAMAKLMDVEQPTPQPPGLSLFAEALRRLPVLHHLGGEGVIGVEILTLVALYSQWCGLKQDAYLYIGVALRLSIALGCNLPENEQPCLPSESAHRVRLWWTVYMLDRRLSSGLGLAAGADERQLRTGLPQHTVGFQSPVPLTINVRIARVTDEIMASLYGKTTISQIALVKKIQSILQELHDILRSFPQSLVFDFSRPLQTVTRTGSSLYLMLFQAIILCTRPILSGRVRVRVEAQQNGKPVEPAPDILAQLCERCNEAATRSLAILYALQKQRIIPRYGFFDLDATFSAAFVLLMVGFIDSSQDQPPVALAQAFHVLEFLSRSGNSAAGQRLQDIAQSSSHVWPNHTLNSVHTGQPHSQTDPTLGEQAANPIPRSDNGPLPTARETGSPPQYRPMALDETQLLEPWEQSTGIDMPLELLGDWEGDLSTEAEGIYSSFRDPTLPLTGVDYMDWLEIEKLFHGPNAI